MEALVAALKAGVPTVLVFGGILLIVMGLFESVSKSSIRRRRKGGIIPIIVGLLLLGFGVGIYISLFVVSLHSTSMSEGPSSGGCPPLEAYDVVGRVESEDGKPVSGAYVSLDVAPLPLQETMSDDRGEFHFILPHEKCISQKGTLNVEAKGYQSRQKQVRIGYSSLDIEVILRHQRSVVLTPTLTSVILRTPTLVASPTLHASETFTPALTLTSQIPLPTSTSSPTPIPLLTLTSPAPSPTPTPMEISFSQVSIYRDLSQDTHGEILYGVALSPHARWLAAVSYSGKVYIWNLDTGVETSFHLPSINGKSPAARAVAFGEYQGQLMLAIGSDDGYVRIWQVGGKGVSEEPIGELVHKNRWPVYSVDFSPNGRWLVSGSWREIRVWDIEALMEGRDGEVLKEEILANVPRPDWPVRGVRFSPRGDQIASVGWDGKVRFWDLEGRLRGQITVSEEVAYSVDYDPTGKRVAVGTFEDKVLVWDIRDIAHPKLLYSLAGHSGDVFAVAYSPSGNVIASGGWDKTLRFWDVQSGKQKVIRRWEGWITGIEFSKDGTLLVACSQKGEILIWHAP